MLKNGVKNKIAAGILCLALVLGGAPFATAENLVNNGTNEAVGNTPSWIQTLSDSVNLRQGPGTSFKQVDTLVPGTVLPVLGEQDNWYKVRMNNGSTAYVASWLVEAAIAPTSTPVSTLATSSAAAIPSNNRAVQVYINGKRMAFDVDPIVGDGRTLVPMAAIFQSMGADITWDGNSRTVTARKGDTTIILPIGSLTPMVNGQAWNLDVPAKIVKNRTLAPLRFVGQALGGKVAWDAETCQAIILSPPNPDDELIAIKVDGETVNLRANPSTSAGVIAALPPGMQLSVCGEQGGWYKVNYLDNEGWIAAWVITPVWGATGDNLLTFPSEEETSTTISNLLTLNYNKAVDGIYLTLQGNSKAKVEENNGSLIYTFADSYLQQNVNIQEPAGSVGISITGYNQGNDAVVQVTIPSSLAYQKNSENSGNTQVLVIHNCITGVVRQTFNSSGERIDITTLLPATYTQRQIGDTMMISLAGVSQGLAQSSYNYNSPIMESLTFAQQASESSYNTSIIIETKEASKFSVGQNSKRTETHILLINQRDIPARNSLVVLDPGHGGKDPGACGSFSQEKDINLAVALKVGAILNQKGINVAYTRTTDVFVPLESEAETGNIMNAALFVAIHCNHANPNAQGTETFYYAPESNPDLYLQKDDRKNLATAIQQRLVVNLGRPDRGVKQDNLLVLRNTKMPSALAELAFISSSEEEGLLNQDDFQNKAAQAIADAIAACMPVTVQETGKE